MFDVNASVLFMKISSLRSLFVLSLTLALPAFAPWMRAQEMATKATSAKVTVTHFVKPTAVDCAKVLPPPPAPGTLSARADLEAVLQMQAWRTPEQVAWAKRIEKNDAFIFGDVLGAWFTRENLPLTAAFLKDVDEDRHAVTEVAKNLFARPRPWVVDPRVQPCVGKPTNDSYPSGHTSSIFTRAGVLAEIFPEQREAIFEFAHRAVWGRIYGGVHFPSDLVGGWTLAEPIVVELKKSAAFQERIEKCRAEIARVAKK
jgi:acid phosphatase (class A)